MPPPDYGVVIPTVAGRNLSKAASFVIIGLMLFSSIPAIPTTEGLFGFESELISEISSLPTILDGQSIIENVSMLLEPIEETGLFDDVLAIPTTFDGPNLFAEISVPSTAVENETISISGTISNSGYEIATNFSVSFYLDDTIFDKRQISYLLPNQKESIMSSWNATLGDHNFKIFVDSEYSVPESNETDNIDVKPIYIQLIEPVPSYSPEYVYNSSYNETDVDYSELDSSQAIAYSVSSNGVTNGDFETGSLTGWTQWKTTLSYVQVGTTYKHLGSYGLRIYNEDDGSTYTSGIHQGNVNKGNGQIYFSFKGIDGTDSWGVILVVEVIDSQGAIGYAYDDGSSNNWCWPGTGDGHIISGEAVSLNSWYTKTINFASDYQTHYGRAIEDTITVKFFSYEDDGNAEVYIDDISISSGDSQFYDDFENGNLNKWDSTGSWVIDSSVKHQGLYSAKCTGGPSSLIKNMQNTHATYEGYFRFGETNMNHYPAIPNDNSGALCYWVCARDNGYFGYYDGSYKNYPTDKTYSANVWYYIKMEFDYAQQKFWVWIDGSSLTPSGISAKNANGQIGTCLTNWKLLNVASGQTGVMWADDVSVTVSGGTTIPPSVTTNAATNIGTTSATLNGNLGSKGSASTVTTKFQYGTTTSYGTTITVSTNAAIGNFNYALTALSQGVTYHYRAVAVGDGTTYGADQTFTTGTTNPPTVTTNSATNIALTSATLNGNLGSKGSASTVTTKFEYGATTSYGSTRTVSTNAAVGSFSYSLTGLTAGTTYHYRAVAVGSGTAYGSDMTFTTKKDTDGDGIYDDQDIDPLVDLQLTVKINRARQIDGVDIFNKGDFYVRVSAGSWWESAQPGEGHNVGDEIFSSLFHTFNVPDNVETITVQIELWDDDTNYIDSDDICDISRDSGGGDENNKDGSNIELVYNLRKGQWGEGASDDWIGDANGYGHTSGDEDGSTGTDQDDCEIWFDITQNDKDGDGLTYWQEVFVYNTNPKIKNPRRYAVLAAAVTNTDETAFKNDISNMRNYLVSNGWHDQDIWYLTEGTENYVDGEATYDNIMYGLDEMAARSDENSLVLLLLVDHGGGYLDHSSGSYPPGNYGGRIDGSAGDVTPNDEAHDGIGEDDNNPSQVGGNEYDENYQALQGYIYDDELSIKLNNIVCKNMVVIINSCFSGGFIEELSNEHTTNSRVILTSAPENDFAYFIPQYTIYGHYFYEALVWSSALGTHSPDKYYTGISNNNGIIEVEEAHAYADEYDTFDTPQKWDGDVSNGISLL